MAYHVETDDDTRPRKSLDLTPALGLNVFANARTHEHHCCSAPPCIIEAGQSVEKNARKAINYRIKETNMGPPWSKSRTSCRGDSHDADDARLIPWFPQ